ncbi:MAG: tetratricopeptide repeat protein [Candidatus Cloacimonetes bacterium]|nr:tetratricopeptide repeat protein [Candidatus Cloacimonadota bacterium]
MKSIRLILLGILLFTGCAYYNTFYNAKKYFTLAQEEDIKDGKPSRTAMQNYDKAMQKCGIILTDYKDSKWAEDALFMMAQCLYYKKTSRLEAKVKFEEIIQYYPDSEHAMRSHIYIARCLKEMNQDDKAYQKLRDFIVSGISKKYLPEALQLMAEYYLEDEEYSQAEYYYQKLIDEHPKSELQQSAYFSLGLLYHRNDKYEQSIKTFQDFLDIKADKKLKLEAGYYIASNNLLAGNPALAMEQIEKLLKDEYREPELNKLRLLKARALAKLNSTEEADIIFELLITENPKTDIAAESSFWRAEMHFRILNDYEKAIEYYNNVRTENSKSPFVEEAVTHSSVASQILQYNSSSSDIELEQLINEQMKLAEYYVEVLALPDSAMAVYNRIISHRDIIATRIVNYRAELDSLSRIVFPEPVMEDTLAAITDSLVITLQDSISVPPVKPQPTRSDTLLQKIETGENEIVQYDQKFIPYVQFVKLWMQKTVFQDSLAVQELYDLLLKDYPDSRYTYAAGQFINNEPVDFLTPAERKENETMRLALEMIPELADSALVLLTELSADSTATYYEKALYTRAYIQFHIYSDTLATKPLFNRLLAFNENSVYAENIANVYNGEKFLILDRLPALVELEAKEQEALETEEAENEEEQMILELEDIEKPESDAPASAAPERSPHPKTNE